LLATLNLSPTYKGVRAPCPFGRTLHPLCQNDYTPKRPTLSGIFETTLLQG